MCLEQSNSYLKILPCMYYSPKANSVTKLVDPLENFELPTHLLHMCPIKAV